MMSTDELRRMLRKMEWQAAKGHLEALLETYVVGDEEELERVNDQIIDFERWMEEEL